MTTSPYTRIATALKTHIGVDLGDVSDVRSPEEFARLFEVATMNFKAGKRGRGQDDDDGADHLRRNLERDPDLHG